ncbi:MAG: cell division protein ZapA [Anaerovoracaceae bacterium]|nr:cell division protein ZapA [Bacillota bacterium]MEE0517160.1 cell division protein ZapA [Anaerovoracaceae bacterium]
MESNKVKVRIYGQEYTIAGEKDEESIRKIASHVNEKMRELGRSFSSNGQGTLAVLTAINLADECFETAAENLKLREENEKLREETEHYIKLWEEAKKNFVQYKESAARAAEEKQAEEDKYKELEVRCSEFENSFFDLQMENMQLKRELEEYKKNNEG